MGGRDGRARLALVVLALTSLLIKTDHPFP